MVKHRGNVVRIAELARCDDEWHEGLDVVVVRFCSPELSGKGAECVGVDRGFCFVRGEAGLTDEGGESVVLGGLRDCLVLRRELRHRTPCLLLGGDGLVRGEFRADVLPYPVEHAPRGRIRIVRGVRCCVAVVGSVGGDVDEVGVPSAGHRNVEVLARRGRIGEHVRGVGRDALSAVGCDGLAEVR